MSAIILAVALVIGHHSDAARWQALSLIESGNQDAARGRAGEVSRWQLLRSEWRRATNAPVILATNTATSMAVCDAVMAKRVGRFVLASHRQPNDREWSLLWHCPAHVDHPRKDEREYADRFEAALKRIE